MLFNNPSLLTSQESKSMLSNKSDHHSKASKAKIMYTPKSNIDNIEKKTSFSRI